MRFNIFHSSKFHIVPNNVLIPLIRRLHKVADEWGVRVDAYLGAARPALKLPACPHVQSMSGIFSIVAHCVLQYLPDVVMHEQTWCGSCSCHLFPPRWD